MTKMPKEIYQTVAELEVHITERVAQAHTLPPGCEMRETILRDIAQLRIYAEAKRWIESTGLKPGT